MGGGTEDVMVRGDVSSGAVDTGETAVDVEAAVVDAVMVCSGAGSCGDCGFGVVLLLDNLRRHC